MTPEQGLSIKSRSMPKRRKTWLTIILNLATPGLGFVYLGKVGTAITVFVISLALNNAAYAVLLYVDTAPLNLLGAALILLCWVVGLIVVSIRFARSVTAEYTLRAYNKWYLYLAMFFVGILVSTFSAPHYGDLESFRIPSESMENALLVGDYFIADVSAYETDTPGYNDVIVIIFPKDGVTKYVERCVGLPGDTVEIVDKVLYINGSPASNPKTIKHIRQNLEPRGPYGKDTPDSFGPFVVPKNHFFVMGDNRDNSYDSRWWGPVPRELLVGKAILIYWSKDVGRIGLRVE